MRNIFITVFALISISLQGQLDSYDIATYVTPDFSFQSLELFPNLRYANTLSSQTSFDLDGGFFYRARSLSRQRISEVSVFQSLDFRRSNSIDTATSFFSGSSVLWDNQFFYKERRFFTLDLSGSSLIIRQRNNDDLNFFGSGTVDLRPHWGMGRVEFVTDAWHAKAMLKALRDKKLLTVEPPRADRSLGPSRHSHQEHKGH